MAEDASRAVLLAEQRRRLQQESSARLERTVRRDLEKERELVQSLLRAPAVDEAAAEGEAAAAAAEADDSAALPS
eukprot:2791626-Prymnesium_polylepis.1